MYLARSRILPWLIRFPSISVTTGPIKKARSCSEALQRVPIGTDGLVVLDKSLGSEVFDVVVRCNELEVIERCSDIVWQLRVQLQVACVSAGGGQSTRSDL